MPDTDRCQAVQLLSRLAKHSKRSMLSIDATACVQPSRQSKSIALRITLPNLSLSAPQKQCSVTRTLALLVLFDPAIPTSQSASIICEGGIGIIRVYRIRSCCSYVEGSLGRREASIEGIVGLIDVPRR
jgi:hypothetical protein